MTIIALTGKQRHRLRALGHHLQPVVLVGAAGVSPAVVRAVSQALDDHELIKVKVAADGPLNRDEAAEFLSAQTSSHVAQCIGRIVLLYRPHPTKPRISLHGEPVSAAASPSKPAPRSKTPSRQGRAAPRRAKATRPS